MSTTVHARVRRPRRQLILAGLVVASAAVMLATRASAPSAPTAGESVGGIAPSSAPTDPTRDPILEGPGAPRDPEPWSAVQWQPVPQPFGPAPDPARDRLAGLTIGGPGVIGWGRMHQPVRNQFNDMGAIYLSRDGRGWTVVPLDAGVGRADVSEPWLVASGPAGILVVGNVCCTAEDGPTLWRSRDGLAWERLGWPDAFGAATQIASLTATADRYVAGGARNGVAALWSSDDGATWTPVDGAAANLGKGGVNDIERTDGGLVAVGWQDADGTSDGALWTSADGQTWARLAAAPLGGVLETIVFRVIPWAGGWLLIGQEGTHKERLACEQAGRVASIDTQADSSGPSRNFSCGWGVETHWVTANGRDWRRQIPLGARNGAVVPPGALIEFRLIAAGGPGLVALGEGAGGAAAAVHVSVDGISWQRIEPAQQLPGGVVMTGFVVSGRTALAVGDGPSAWIGVAR